MDIYLGCYLKVPKVQLIDTSVVYACTGSTCGKKYSPSIKFCSECGSAVARLEVSKDVIDYPPPDLDNMSWVDFVVAFEMDDGSVAWVPNRFDGPGKHFDSSDAARCPITNADMKQRLEEGQEYFRKFMEAFKKAYHRDLELEYGLVLGHY